MVCIKLKFSPIIMMLLLTTFTFMLFSNSILASGRAIDLDFVGEPEYELVDTIERGGNTIGWSYQISLEIENAGNQQSKSIVVELEDEDDVSLTKRLKIGPGETKNIIFNWSAVSSRDQKIKVSFYPSDLDDDKTQYNSGSTSFTIIIEDKDAIPGASTPGFEFVFLILSILILIYSNRRKRKI